MTKMIDDIITNPRLLTGMNASKYTPNRETAVDGIPVYIIYDPEMDDTDMSSVGCDNSSIFDSESDHVRLNCPDDEIVESTYKDLEDNDQIIPPPQSFFEEPKTKESTDRSSGEILQHQDDYEDAKETKNQISTESNGGLPFTTDDDEDLSYTTSSSSDLWRLMKEGIAPTTTAVTCGSIRGRKIRRKKQPMTINLHTRVERIQHQAMKPFRVASKMIFWSTGRLHNAVRQGPDPGLFLSSNLFLLQKGKRCLPLNNNNDTLYSIIPNIMSLDSSDSMESNGDGDEIKQDGEEGGQDDRRWLYARQLQPVGINHDFASPNRNE
ncbi:hypothetical protein FRACYDRAFT_241686 [Fragilariopsis cylindrus CCMP1102]|uniref:Uncharacterized protein n=1 Tax=Fragilariopsis cylindrus CCMP1102 TaxID=635003 RepID=A0A1E7F577_9STRA|nr:hypothetical protein FRACYDRAFT_241686 [Fragilariopsis cylindrus CCMP1102]|eukprot:OEU13348.1 hypothetical protein FRACYDRAFT_241686 [Fragilariopsis cylindrus CCMP1102]